MIKRWLLKLFRKYMVEALIEEGDIKLEGNLKVKNIEADNIVSDFISVNNNMSARSVNIDGYLVVDNIRANGKVLAGHVESENNVVAYISTNKDKDETNRKG